ncbi:MAG: chromosome segregation SMC family protein [Candidatus Pacearchaeota archaeon]
MTYVKKLVMNGFKSFAKKTEIPFTGEINVVLGPNGSGKSNIIDALCFVLGRLSTKSIRATKASNLIFMGSQSAGAAKEASVELIFDNSDNTFSLDANEVSLKRIVKKNGQGIYRINGENKTRQEIVTLLAQAGIDPNGFNIVLQGEIQNFVKMTPDQRRKVIEEVSGISVYETRKQKSMKELEKTDKKLKEVSAILKERTSYLNNLEKERKQALRYQKLQKDLENLKASVINSDLQEKKKEKEKIDADVDKKNKEIWKVREKMSKLQQTIDDYKKKVDEINSNIKSSTGQEQEKLNQEIANLRADLAGLNVNKENAEKKLADNKKKQQDLDNSIKDSQKEIDELKKSSDPNKDSEQKKELEKKKNLVDDLEKKRKDLYMAKTELKSIDKRLDDKNKSLQSYQRESEILTSQIEKVEEGLYDRNTKKEKIDSLKKKIEEKKEELEHVDKRERELEKQSILNNSEIEKHNKLIDKISQMDTCPTCKSDITQEHIDSIKAETMPQINTLKQQISEGEKEMEDLKQKKERLRNEIAEMQKEVSKRDSDLSKLKDIDDKKDRLKSIQANISSVKKEIQDIEKRKQELQKTVEENQDVEEKYETALVEYQDLSSKSKENLDSEISFKQKELERSQISLKQLKREQEEHEEELSKVNASIKEKNTLLEQKRKQEQELSKKFDKMIKERDSYQEKVRESERELQDKKNEVHNKEQEVNNLKIEIARVNASVENLQEELKQCPNAEIISGKKDNLKNRLEKTKDMVSGMGNINLKSLEVYDEVKKEYDEVKERSDKIEKEKEGIMKVIETIDRKKKRAFMKTMKSLNEAFSRNFSLLSSKGEVYLELENKKQPFEGGVGIVVRTGHGKYFDATSLSGGEQTLVALSLIFAIQEYDPYPFYILDEIDAALDKRNSQRLANLLSKHMQKGQYILISHNDETIASANNVYGISMHDGISKVVSMEV